MPYAKTEEKTKVEVVGVSPPIKPIPWTLIGMLIAGTMMIISSAYVR